MACRYTFQGKTYSAIEFDDVLRAMQPSEASKYMSGVTSVPSAPFIQDTKSWTALALKRIISYAVDNGFDKVAWTTGEQQNARYDLSKQVDSINYTKKGDTYHVWAFGKDGQRIEIGEHPAARLPDVVGKDIADKIIAGHGEELVDIHGENPEKAITGKDLSVGGMGMKGYYDQIIPQVASKIIEKFGGKVGEVDIGVPKNTFTVTRATISGVEEWRVWDKNDKVVARFPTEQQAHKDANDRGTRGRKSELTQPGFTLTQEMRSKVISQGMPLFNRKQSEAFNNGIDSPLQEAYHASDEELNTLRRSIQASVKIPLRASAYQNAKLPDAENLGKFAAAFQKQVVGLSTSVPAKADFNGVVLTKALPDLIFLNAKADRPHMAILGHELVHHLRASNPELYDRFRDAIDPYINANYPDFAKDYKGDTEDVIDEEFLAEIVSDGMFSQKFWYALGQRNPSLLRQIVDVVHELFLKAMHAIGYTNKTEKYLTDFDKVMQIAGDVMGQYGLDPKSVMGDMSFVDEAKYSEADTKQTDTPAFRKWFGDSKVVNADGEPLVVYHGTKADADFVSFKRRPGDIGIHFGDVGQANDRLSYTNNFGNPRLIPVYLSIKNPLRMHDAGAWNADNLNYDLLKKFPNDFPRGVNINHVLKSTKDIREFLQSKGYDGVVYKNTGEVEGGEKYAQEQSRTQVELVASQRRRGKPVSQYDSEDQKTPEYLANKAAYEAYIKFREDNAQDSYIAFERTQIKSPLGNNGQFSPNNPDIRYSKSESNQSEYSVLSDPSEQEAQEVQSGIEGKSAIEAAQFVADNAPDASHRLIAAKVAVRLRELEAVGSVFTMNVSHVGGEIPDTMLQAGVRGQVFQKPNDPVTHIWVNGADVTGVVGVSYETVLHELVHAATQKSIDLGEYGAGGEIGASAKDLLNVYEHIKGIIDEKKSNGITLNTFEKHFANGRNNSLANMHELVSWAMTNKPTQDYLESIPYENTTLWGAFVEAVRKLLGLSEKSNTALSEVIGITERLMNVDAAQLMIESMRQGQHMQMNYARSNADGSGRGIRNFSFSKKQSDIPGMAQPPAAPPRIIGDSGREYTPEQRAAMERTGSTVTPKSIKETLSNIWKDAGKKMAQGLADQFRPVRDIDAHAYTLMRLSKGATGAFEAFMQHGKLSLKNGAYDADTSGGVLESVFYPLGKESTDFMRWVAGNRAERLSKEGKENLFSQEDIAAFKSLADGKSDFDYTLENGTVTRDRTVMYRDSLKKFNAFNKNVLDMAEQSGLIDGASRALWEHEFYVPFYRTATEEDGGVRGMNIKSGVIRQQAFQKLKGGEQQLNDLLENTLMNWAHLIDASAKNRAAMATLQAAEKVGAARKALPGEKKTVWFMENGQKAEYKVEDAYLMEAISSLEYAGLRGPAMDAMSTMKHWLTVGVTASPFFKVRNLVRDSMQAIGTASNSDLSYNPLANVAKGFKLTDRKNAAQEYVSALAGGGLIRFGTMLEGSEAKRTRQLIKRGAKDSHILDNENKVRAFYDKYVEPGILAYNELGNRGEEINRMALYDTLIKQGMDHATASLMARDLMDFSMQGTWTSVRFLTQIVPFFNARLQGLYKLGRASKDDKARFAIVLGATAMASLALLAAYGDDDDWKRREDWDRDNYWWFKIGGEAFRIPKPFEIGAIATMAERSAELLFDKEMTGGRFVSLTLGLAGNQLAMNPTPQLFKPIIDLYANKDSFTGRDIESMGMERLAPDYRFKQSTSLVARGISTAGNTLTGDHFLSPVQIDHINRAYFGWLGSFVVGSADMAVRSVSSEPTKPAIDYWKVATGGMVSGLEGAHSRYVSQMYDQARELEEAYGTWRNLLKEGKIVEARQYRDEHKDDLVKYRHVEGVKRQAAVINERIRIIERSNLGGEEKRVKINELRQRQDKIARQLSAR